MGGSGFGLGVGGKTSGVSGFIGTGFGGITIGVLGGTGTGTGGGVLTGVGLGLSYLGNAGSYAPSHN